MDLYPNSFTMKITIGQNVHVRGLCDLRAYINLMTLSLYHNLRLGSPKKPLLFSNSRIDPLLGQRG